MLALSTSVIFAEEKAISKALIDEKNEQTLAEKLENLGLLYKDKTNPILQEFWLLGRYHVQYHDSDGSNGENSGWEDRRARFGFQATMFSHLTLHAQAISGTDFDPDYNGFSELWARWQFSEALNLTIGQQKHRFTHDRNISSRYINYLERSMFTNMMALDYTPAVTLSGKSGKLEYYTGIFSNATGTDMWNAFTELDSGWSYIAAGTYNLDHFVGADTAYFYGSYLHSDARDNATNLTRFDNAVSGALILTEGSASLVTEVTAGFGASSSEANGLSAQRRYERPAGLPSGDFYQAGYLGFNYYIASHRIKLISGIEYAKMNDEDVVTASVGFRFYFGPHSNAPFPGNKMLDGQW